MQQVVHLVVTGDAMKTLLLVLLLKLIPTAGTGNERAGKWQTQHGVITHALEELHDALTGEVTRMQDAGLIKELLLNV